MTINFSDYNISNMPAYQSAKDHAKRMLGLDVNGNDDNADVILFAKMVGYKEDGTIMPLKEWYKFWTTDSPNQIIQLSSSLIQLKYINNINYLTIVTTWILCRYFGNPALYYDGTDFVPVVPLDPTGLPSSDVKCSINSLDTGYPNPNPFADDVSGCIYPYPSNPGNIRYTEMQNVLFSFISNIAGAPSFFLQNFVETNNITREEIVNSPALLNWFGCYSPDPILPDTAEISKQCDPLCSRLETIKLYSDSSPVQLECQGTVCVIDNLTVAAASNSGTVQITQICDQCVKNKGQCRCIINVDTPGLLNRIGSDEGGLADPVVLKQYCPNSECVTYDEKTLTSRIIPCDQGTKLYGLPKEEKKDFSPTFWYFLIVIVVIFLLFFFASVYGSHNVKAYVPFIPYLPE